MTHVAKIHKTVQVLGSEFDCLPHKNITVAGKGTGGTLTVALQRAVANMLADPRLYRKHLGAFRLSAVVIAETTAKRASANVYLDAPAASTAAAHTGNCGDCLMEHAEVVKLAADGSCPCCQRNHAAGGAA